MNDIIQVDKRNNQIGLIDRIQAHRGGGLLHRAISVLALRFKGDDIEVLLQKRATEKLLWPGFWTNTVCTHPILNEKSDDCARRRLKEEMGLEKGKIHFRHVFDFVYQAEYDLKYSEHEFDSVYAVWLDQDPSVDSKEVSDWKWMSWNLVQKDIKINSGYYTPWFKLIVQNSKMNKYLRNSEISNRK